MSTMPARHRERYSGTPHKPFTITMEFCSRAAGIRVHVALETLSTMSRHTHQVHRAGEKVHRVQRLSAQLHSRDLLIDKMKLQLAQLKRMKFGGSSEQPDAQIAQLELSLEELEASAAEATVAKKRISCLKTQKIRHVRCRPLVTAPEWPTQFVVSSCHFLRLELVRRSMCQTET